MYAASFRYKLVVELELDSFILFLHYGYLIKKCGEVTYSMVTIVNNTVMYI